MESILKQVDQKAKTQKEVEQMGYDESDISLYINSDKTFLEKMRTQITEKKWISVEDVKPLLVELFDDKGEVEAALKIAIKERNEADEKNKEYAKLVAAQAEEYAEKRRLEASKK